MQSDSTNEQYFQYEEASGECFQGVRPWLGAISPPSKVPENDPTPPEKKLAPHHVYGYRCHDCRDNIFYTKNPDEVVYMTAEIGVVHQKSTNTQRFFGCGPDEQWEKSHSDDITALTLHPNKEICATGQVGKNPLIYVWRLKDFEVLACMKQGVDTRAVRTIGFSRSGKYIVTTADDNDHSVFVFDWEKGAMIAQNKSGADPILDIDFSTADEETFATAGKNGVKFWNFDNPKDFSYKKGIFGSHKLSDMTSVKYLPSGKCISGSATGDIYIWASNSCVKTIDAHSKPVSALNCREDSIVSGGRDGKVCIFDSKFALKSTVEVESSPIGIDQDDAGNILVGLRNGGIKEILSSGLIRTFLDSHSDGEVWGLAICPNTGLVLTCGDDNKIFAYDPTTRRVVSKGIIDEKKETKKKFAGGASTLSTYPPNQQARAIAISKTLGHVVVGINDGTASVRKGVNNLSDEICSLEEPKEWIEVISYSPKEDLLAIGCHDNFIYIYDTANYKLKNVLKGHSSYITALDWSADGETIQSNCGAYELLFFDVSTGKQVGSGGTAYKDTEWATNSSKFGWAVQGIFPPGVDGTHVNGVDRSKDGSLIASADDWGHVNLYRYPCLENNKGSVYKGHSEHVVRVKFDNKGEFVYSVGGYDQTLIQWRMV